MKNDNTGGAGGPLARVIAQALLLSFLLANARAADPSTEPKSASEATDVEVFQDARPLRAPSDRFYPAREKQEGKEGWVMLNMMIDPRGKPYEIAVLDSTGNVELEKAAIRAVDGMAFAPAKRGGTPIDSNLTFKMAFYPGDHPARGASVNFQTAFKSFLTAIDAKSKEQADVALQGMKAQNLYEDAFEGYCKYLYDHIWGTEVQQLADLRRAVAGERLTRYLPKELFSKVLTAQFALQVKVKDYGSALYTWNSLEPIASSSDRDVLKQTVDQIIAVRDGNQAVSTPGQTANGTTWNGHLFKSHFAISVATGAVSEIKLRCKKQYIFFSFKPELEYTVNSSAGECFIEVVGDPNTTFELVQS